MNGTRKGRGAKRTGIGAATSWDGALFKEFASILKADDVPTLRDRTMKLARIFGFQGYYAVTPLIRDHGYGRFMYCRDMPEVWERQWRRRLHWIDPLIDYSLTHPQMFKWSWVFDQPDLTPAQKRYARFCRDLGLDDGLGIICHGPAGRTAFLGFGLPTGPDSFSAQSYMAMSTLSQLSFNRYCDLLTSKTPRPELSPREVEIMRWAARGKSNADIATILAISRHTIDTHMRRVFRKLGTSDRTVACLKTLELGYIQASEPRAKPADKRRSED